MRQSVKKCCSLRRNGGDKHLATVIAKERLPQVQISGSFPQEALIICTYFGEISGKPAAELEIDWGQSHR